MAPELCLYLPAAFDVRNVACHLSPFAMRWCKKSVTSNNFLKEGVLAQLVQQRRGKYWHEMDLTVKVFFFLLIITPWGVNNEIHSGVKFSPLSNLRNPRWPLLMLNVIKNTRIDVFCHDIIIFRCYFTVIIYIIALYIVIFTWTKKSKMAAE